MVDSRFSELELRSKTSFHTNSGRLGFETYNPKGEAKISPLLRSMKSDVPKFNGTEPQGWILRVEDFFDFHGTSHHMRLRIVHFHMEGRAAACFQWMQVNNLLTTWLEFIPSLKNRFGSSPYNDLQRLHSKLTQISTIAESQTEYVVQIQAIEEEKLKTADAYFASDTSLLHSFVAIIPIYMCANKEKDGKRILEVVDFLLKLL